MSAAGGSPDRGRPALSRCITVDAEDFTGRVWGEEPLLSHTSGFADLFGADAVDELVSRRGLRTPFLRMARDGDVLAAARFTSPGGAGAQVADQADPAKILVEMGAGATLVLQALHRVWPPLRDFADQLVRDLGHPVQVNAYVTPPSSQGFASHYDTHDVFVLQVEGTKRWRLHRPVVEHPLASQPWQDRKPDVARRAAEPPFLETTLEPGDSLYLPRGWLHSASALGATSIHLTVGIHALTANDVVSAIARAAQDEPELRGNLPLGVGTSPDRALAASEPLVKQVATWVAALDPEVLANAVTRRFDDATPTEAVAPLQQLRLAAGDNAPVTARLRRGLRADVTATDGRVTLRAGSRFVAAPESCEAALRHVTTGAKFRSDDLPGVDALDGERLARRLLAEAIVVPVAP